ncbi:retrovirus-related pol polyprotein from transposon TNT 1-94, partial [Tanacetum coccineum]
VFACEDSSNFKVSMKEEMDSLRKNKTWELVDHPARQKLVSCKWLFKIKEGIEGVQKPRYKARLVARGFTQRACIDYNEVFSLQPPGYEQATGSSIAVTTAAYITGVMHQGVQMPLGGHFKLSLKDCPVRDCDVEKDEYLANPGKNHWEAMKWILKYLRGTANVGLVYGTNRGNHVDVTAFVDSDYAKDPDKCRSITGYAFLVQGYVETIWLRGLLRELGVELNKVAVNCDNQGAIHLSRNHFFHERTKHINVRYHFIREVLEAKTVEVLKVGTEHNVVDALTKVVPRHKLQHCLELLSVSIG